MNALGYCQASLQDGKDGAYANWLRSHKPFHWFVEFHEIMKSGGFDVVIGNPPWKEYSAVKREYTVRGYATENCGNLYALCIERCLALRSGNGGLSFIVQLPLSSSSRMADARRLMRRSSLCLHVASFDDRPGKLFEGLQNCRSVVFVARAPGHKSHRGNELATTGYIRWHSQARHGLFERLGYTVCADVPLCPDQFPRFSTESEPAVFQRLAARSANTVGSVLRGRHAENFIFYQEATRYWAKATVGLPFYAKNGTVGAPAHGRYLRFESEGAAHGACALLNSSLFYAYFVGYGDCFHVSDRLASGFPLPDHPASGDQLIEVNRRLMDDLRTQAERKTIETKAGDTIAYDEFFCGKSKPLLDQLDCLLAQHYGFTDEELDFIINYDLKYRMGREGGEEA